MRKTLIAVIFLYFFLTPFLVNAQPAPPVVNTLGPTIQLLPPNASVKILSPINSGNYSNPVHIIFAVEATGLEGQFGNVGISIDGGVINSVTNFIEKSVVQSDADELHWLSTTVLADIWQSLSEGIHNATVYYGWQYVTPSQQRYDVAGYATAIFTVVNAQAGILNTADSDISNYTQPEISISSPANMTFKTNVIPLNFTISHIQPLATKASIFYSLDGKNTVSLYSVNETRIDFIKDELPPFHLGDGTFNLVIGNLSDGFHNLVVFAKITYLYYGLISKNVSIQFSIDSTSPTISGLSIMNKTYNNQTIPLSFTTNEKTSWIAYALDNHENVTINGNTTLTGLEYGFHNLTIYANDTLGNMGKSDTIFFEVKKEVIQAIPLSWILVMILIVIGVSSFLLVYFKKYPKRSG